MNYINYFHIFKRHGFHRAIAYELANIRSIYLGIDRFGPYKNFVWPSYVKTQPTDSAEINDYKRLGGRH